MPTLSSFRTFSAACCCQIPPCARDLRRSLSNTFLKARNSKASIVKTLASFLPSLPPSLPSRTYVLSMRTDTPAAPAPTPRRRRERRRAVDGAPSTAQSLTRRSLASRTNDRPVHIRGRSALTASLALRVYTVRGEGSEREGSKEEGDSDGQKEEEERGSIRHERGGGGGGERR